MEQPKPVEAINTEDLVQVAEFNVGWTDYPNIGLVILIRIEDTNGEIQTLALQEESSRVLIHQIEAMYKRPLRGGHA